MLSLSSSYRCLSLFGVFAFLLWLPSLWVPFWGDDYAFLTQARESRVNGLSWWHPFFNASTTGFWRPLSMDTGWRFVEQTLQGNLLSAHLYSWVLHVFSLAGIGFFAYQVAVSLRWSQPLLIALITAAIHAVHVVTYLPVHWVAAMNSPTLIFFISITLALWILLPRLNGMARYLCLISLPLLQLLSLFSKEVAILVPGMVVLLAIFLRNFAGYKKGDIAVWWLCVGICLIWLYFYKQFTPGRDPVYGLVLGKNLATNFMGFSAWIFNVPREALRMILTDKFMLGALWAAACFISMAAAYWLSLKHIAASLSRWQWLAALAFMLVAYGPYFVLANQSYEYYAALALILPLVLVARGLLVANKLKLGLLLIALSSLLAVQGTRSVAYPGVIERAYWGERQIEFLSRQPVTPPLLVDLSNPHQFAALGVAGLEWRLGLPKGSVILTNRCDHNGIKMSGQMLIQNSQGDFEWKDCPK